MKLENNEYNRANLCCGQAKGDTCGKTKGGAIVINDVGQYRSSLPINEINMVITNVTTYSPVMPRVISGKVLDADQEGWMGNGKKIHNRKSDDLIQINQCNDKVFTARTCFMDSEQKPILMKSARLRVFDIDMGDNPTREGPEAVQFSCPGGTFEVYGKSPPFVSWTAGRPFLVQKKATHNGLTKYKYNCPAQGPNELVTLWASMELGEAPVGETASAAPHEVTVAQQERLVLIEFKNVECVDLTYAAMPPAYRELASGTVKGGNRSHGWNLRRNSLHGGNPLNGSLPINYDTFKDLQPGHCGGGEFGQTYLSRPGQNHGGGRNIQISGYINLDDKANCTLPRDCTKKIPIPPTKPEPVEPRISPDKVSIHGDPM